MKSPARIARLFAADTAGAEKLSASFAAIGQRLKIHCSQGLLPFVVSVHNAFDRDHAVCYVRIPGTDCLLELYRGLQAFDTAVHMENAAIDNQADSDGTAFFRTATSDHFKRRFLAQLKNELDIPFDPALNDILHRTFFGQSRD